MSIIPKNTGISISEGAKRIIDVGYDLDDNNAILPLAELDLTGGGIGMRAYEVGVLSHQFALNTLGVLVQSGVDPSQSVTWSNLANKVEAVGALSTATNATTLNVNNTIIIQNGETSLPPTSSIEISCDADIPQFLINGSAGIAGQVLGNTLSGIDWVSVALTTPTLQEVLDTDNTTTTSIIIQNGYTNTITDLGMTFVDNLTLIASAEYTESGITLTKVGEPDNIVINPSIVLNTTEDGSVNSGIQSIYSSNLIGYSSSFKIEHTTVATLPITTLTLNEDFGTPFDYNKSTQTPTSLILSSSYSADQQSLDLTNGLTTTQIQSPSSNLQVVSATDFTNEVNFTFVDSPPHCDAVPQFGNDLTNKLYVDTKVVASGGGQQMYFNQSVSSSPAPYKSLGTTIVVAPQETITTLQLNPVLGTPQLIAQFITAPFYPNVSTIPAGIWTANIYGKVAGGTTGTLYYMIKVSTIDVLSGITLLGTGTGIVDVDATGIDIVLYTVSTTIDTVTGLNLSDRILVEILTNGIANNPTSTLTTYFQDGTYSFLTTPLISGTNLLGLNNSWTGSNTFAVQPITTSVITAYPITNTGFATTAWVFNAIAYAEKGKITSLSVPALAISGTLTFAHTYTVIPLVLLTVDMGSGTVIVSCCLAGTTLTTFNYILSSLSGVSSLNYYVITI